MNLTDAELRQLRAWAVETALGKAALEQQNCADHHTIEIATVIGEARKLVNFVKAPR